MIAAAKEVLSPSLAWLRSTLPVLSLLALAGICPCCLGQLPSDLALPSETINTGTLVFQASDSITNSASFVVQDPATVTLTAGNYITLQPGFDAVATSGTATFQAAINPNVTQWQPIPVPAPPTACTYCGLDFAEANSGITAQATYPPSKASTLYAVCLDENEEIVACNLSLSVAAYQNTNGHYHNFPIAPTSVISPTSGYTGDYPNLQMPVTLTTTQVGQFETISLIPTDCGEGDTCIETNYDYAVGYNSLVYIEDSDIFIQIGGNTTNHGDNTFNHYMTVNASTGLQNAATYYINQNNPGQPVCINDMALPIGGKFDICNSAAIGCKDAKGNLIVNPWISPHISHDQGMAADVAATAGQCPAGNTVNLNLFLQACINEGNSLAANTITEGNHVHCRWAQ